MGTHILGKKNFEKSGTETPDWPKYLQRLSRETAMKIFNSKALATVTYGWELIWEYLTRKQLLELENLKTRFLKRALGLSKYMASWLVYVSARGTFLLDDLRLKLLLPCTESLQVVLRELEAKRDEIPAEFYITDAMTSNHWKPAGYNLRHTVTRFAVHGFITESDTEGYHQPGPDCVCVRDVGNHATHIRPWTVRT